MVNTIKFIKNGLVKRNKLVLKKKRKLLFFVIPTVLKDTSGKDLNHEARKGLCVKKCLKSKLIQQNYYYEIMLFPLFRYCLTSV